MDNPCLKCASGGTRQVESQGFFKKEWSLLPQWYLIVISLKSGLKYSDFTLNPLSETGPTTWLLCFHWSQTCWRSISLAKHSCRWQQSHLRFAADGEESVGLHAKLVKAADSTDLHNRWINKNAPILNQLKPWRVSTISQDTDGAL